MIKNRNKTYLDYYRSNSTGNWPLSEKEFWAKMSEDMEFCIKWTLPSDITTPVPKNCVKTFLKKLIRMD